MLSAKMAAQNFLKRKLFLNNSYDVIVSAHGVSNKILSRDSNYIVILSCDQSLVTLSISMTSIS